MPKMTEKEIERHAVETGTHRLMGAVLSSNPCGCNVIGVGNLQSPIRIEFCKKHKKALEVLHEVYQQHQCTTPAESFCRVCKIIEDAGFGYQQ